MARKFTEFRIDRGPEHLTLPLRITDDGGEFSTTLFGEEIKGATAASVREEAQRRYTAALGATWDLYYIVRTVEKIEAIEMTREEITLAHPLLARPHDKHDKPKAPQTVRLFRPATVGADGKITPQFDVDPREVIPKPDDAKLIPATEETHRALLNMIGAISDVDAKIGRLKAQRAKITDEFEGRFSTYYGHGMSAKPRHPERRPGNAEADEVVTVCNRVVNDLADKIVFPKLLK